MYVCITHSFYVIQRCDVINCNVRKGVKILELSFKSMDGCAACFRTIIGPFGVHGYFPSQTKHRLTAFLEASTVADAQYRWLNAQFPFPHLFFLSVHSPQKHKSMRGNNTARSPPATTLQEPAENKTSKQLRQYCTSYAQ